MVRVAKCYIFQKVMVIQMRFGALFLVVCL